MRIYGISEPRISDVGCVMAIGFFDGVHIGHRALISRAVSYAKERGLEVGVFTFSSEGGIKRGTPRIYTTAERLRLIESLGVDFAVVCDLSEIADSSPSDFVRGILVERYGAVCAAVGYNFRFGRGASADASELAEIMKMLSLDTVICEAQTYRGESVSSSVIRTDIEKGDAARAAELLGEPYFITGRVEHGLGLGKSSLGFPTVNLPLREGGVIPRAGVYKSALTLKNKTYFAIANIGSCPTFVERKPHAEVHIIDFSGDVYGECVKLQLLEFLRDERKFKSEKELKMQINIDINRIKNENGDKNG